MEMVAEYIKQRFPAPLAGAVLEMADVGNKGIDYPPGPSPVVDLAIPSVKA